MFRDPLQNEKLKVFDILTTLRECLTQSEKFLFLFAACRNGRHRFLYFMHKRLIICIKIFRASRDSATELPKKIYINLIIMQSMQFFMHKFCTHQSTTYFLKSTPFSAQSLPAPREQPGRYQMIPLMHRRIQLPNRHRGIRHAYLF